jgi:hypothetical protein
MLSQKEASFLKNVISFTYEDDHTKENLKKIIDRETQGSEKTMAQVKLMELEDALGYDPSKRLTWEEAIDLVLQRSRRLVEIKMLANEERPQQ